MWSFKQHGGRPLTTAERRTAAEISISIPCRIKKEVLKLSIPNLDLIGGWECDQTYPIPLYLVDILANEGMVQPELPYYLHLEWIQKALVHEAQDPNLSAPVEPYAIEVAEFFFEYPTHEPWESWLASAAPSTANSQASQIGHGDERKLTRATVTARKKVKEAFDDFLKLRRTKILGLMRDGGPLDPKILVDHCYPSSVISNLYMREHRWITPILRPAHLKLKLGAYSMRSIQSEYLLGTLGLDWIKCSDQQNKLEVAFTEEVGDMERIFAKCRTKNGKTTASRLQMSIAGLE